MRQPKTGRRANENERKHAREWVSFYRMAQAEPGGRLCLNPEDPPDEQTWIDGNDPEYLLRMLEDFSEHGTFEPVGVLATSIQLLPLRMEYKRARASGKTHEKAVQALADCYNLSTRTIERKLRTDNP